MTEPAKPFIPSRSMGRRTARSGGPSLIACVLLTLLPQNAACSRPAPHPVPPADPVPVEDPGFETSVALPVDTLYHDASMFTQGLCFHGGDIYESSGGYGSSRLRRIAWPSMEVLDEAVLPEGLFGEGIAIVDDTLCMLTWREGTALRFTVPDLEQCGSFSYDGEGWGLAASDSLLYMSDGTGTITVRDPSTFSETGRLEVRVGGSGASFLNELEYRGGILYANQWGLGTVLAIDAASGRVLSVMDASGLLDPSEWPGADVLNGIAFDPAGRMILTGKRWPFMFAVEAVTRP